LPVLIPGGVALCLYACSQHQSTIGDTQLAEAFLSEDTAGNVHSWEVQLVLEFCDKGSLRDLLSSCPPVGPFALPGEAVVAAGGACGCMWGPAGAGA
jgi:hypothetical protein